MSDQHPQISEDRLFWFEKQEVIVNNFDFSGYILDIGGGGEGVIGKLKGQQVIAIDSNKRELEEAPAGPLKVIMDATDLQFLDCAFGIATSFFTLMYIKGADHEKVFNEVFRVLVPGGLFLIWDVLFPQRLDSNKDVAVFPFSVKLPREGITASYGVLWPDEERGLSYYVNLATNMGFNVVEHREDGRVLFLKLRKP